MMLFKPILKICFKRIFIRAKVTVKPDFMMLFKVIIEIGFRSLFVLAQVTRYLYFMLLLKVLHTFKGELFEQKLQSNLNIYTSQFHDIV